jgi:phosphocarrier protein HPr
MTGAWLEKNIDLKDKHSLHMRPAQRIVETATKFRSDIRAVKNGLDCNAKSILDMIDFAYHMVRATEKDDHTFTLRASGEDAQQALDALSELINERFGLD